MKKHQVKNQNAEMLHCNISAENKKAFTLVELIIVITILAILATISFMSFQSYTINAKRSATESTLTNVEKALQSFQVTT
jgi:prepilin-type N-terminal cleavage/methylation domain-containing protein